MPPLSGDQGWRKAVLVSQVSVGSGLEQSFETALVPAPRRHPRRGGSGYITRVCRGASSGEVLDGLEVSVRGGRPERGAPDFVRGVGRLGRNRGGGARGAESASFEDEGQAVHLSVHRREERGGAAVSVSNREVSPVRTEELQQLPVAAKSRSHCWRSPGPVGVVDVTTIGKEDPEHLCLETAAERLNGEGTSEFKDEEELTKTRPRRSSSTQDGVGGGPGGESSPTLQITKNAHVQIHSPKYRVPNTVKMAPCVHRAYMVTAAATPPKPLR